MKTEFPKEYLAAASQFMASQDLRYYLNGVFIEVGASETRLTATDGSAAATVRFKTTNIEKMSVIVPAATVLIALKLQLRTLDLENVDGTWSLGGVRFIPVEGLFPDYRRIFPSKLSGEAGHYAPALIYKFAKAGKALKRKDAPIVRQNGVNEAALVHFYAFDDFVGVLMPLRMFSEKMPDLGTPAWGALPPE